MGKHCKLLLCHFTLFLIISSPVLSQADSTSPQKDLIEVFGRIFSKGEKKVPDPWKPQFSVLPAAGYAMNTGWAGIVAANIAFYIDTSISEKKISAISTNFDYTEYRQAILPFYANIWTKGNKYNIQIDDRYIKYPSLIYNIGKGSPSSSGYNIDYKGLKLHQTLLRAVAKDAYLGVGYYYDRIWDVHEMDPPAGIITSFQAYGQDQNVVASGPVLRFLVDTRSSTINPQQGWFGNMTYRPNMKSLGSTSNWQMLQLEARRYLNFPSNTRNILALWTHNWFTASGKPPFLMLPSTGWDDAYNSGRGYIQGRFRDRNMLYLESEYRFVITPNGLFGGVLFANVQNFSANALRGYQGWIPGGGMGLRIKVNKQSGANVCIDYGFGREGSRGFAVNLGELF